MSSGSCSYGERCQFSHNPDDDPRGAPGVRSTPQAAARGDRNTQSSTLPVHWKTRLACAGLLAVSLDVIIALLEA